MSLEEKGWHDFSVRNPHFLVLWPKEKLLHDNKNEHFIRFGVDVLFDSNFGDTTISVNAASHLPKY